jgi:hypothetical protein
MLMTVQQTITGEDEQARPDGKQHRREQRRPAMTSGRGAFLAGRSDE